MSIPLALPIPFHPYNASAEPSLVDVVKTTETPAMQSASIRQASSTTPDPQSVFMRLDGTAAAEVRSLLDVERTAPIGLGAQVLEAKLLLYKAEPWSAGTHVLTLQPIDAAWDASIATWANQPALRAGTLAASVPGAGADEDLVEIDVTTLVAASVSADDASGTRWHGVHISKNTTGEDKFYSAFAAPDVRPKLRIKWNTPPDAPSDLLPNGGRRVSEVRPELVWRFHDPDANDTLTSGQVQIDDADDFETPTYDSGKVTMTAPRFDLNAPPTGAAAVSDLPVNTIRYWRAKQWDSHNLESDWSAAASFQVVLKGTFSLLSPSSSSVTSPTPAISWSLTGATQAQYQVLIERLVAGVWTTHWDQGWTIGVVTSVTVPDAYRLVEGESYRVTVRVKDTIEREDMAGDRSHMEATRDFTLTGITV